MLLALLLYNMRAIRLLVHTKFPTNNIDISMSSCEIGRYSKRAANVSGQSTLEPAEVTDQTVRQASQLSMQ